MMFLKSASSRGALLASVYAAYVANRILVWWQQQSPPPSPFPWWLLFGVECLPAAADVTNDGNGSSDSSDRGSDSSWQPLEMWTFVQFVCTLFLGACTMIYASMQLFKRQKLSEQQLEEWSSLGTPRGVLNAVLAFLTEECVFRLLLMRELHWSALSSSLLFGALHLLNLSYAPTPYVLLQCVRATLMGYFMLAPALLLHGIRFCIVLHFAVNFMAIGVVLPLIVFDWGGGAAAVNGDDDDKGVYIGQVGVRQRRCSCADAGAMQRRDIYSGWISVSQLSPAALSCHRQLHDAERNRCSVRFIVGGQSVASGVRKVSN